MGDRHVHSYSHSWVILSQSKARVCAGILKRLLAPPCSSGSRRLAAFVAIIVGMSRTGLYYFSHQTVVRQEAYAGAAILIGILLLASVPFRRTIYARIIAAVAAGIFAGMGTDLWLAAGQINVSTLILFLMGYTAIGEAAVNSHDC